ncbi:MAG: hypothetical protein PF485_13805 [Bacteroidales bacterium]|jgi:hypothetical protein|nr:hypothetical protein [Bacteroidales bacterium]
MKKSKLIILIIIFFLMGILLDRAFLYYEMGEKNKILLLEQEIIKEDYKMLIKQFESVEQELLLRKLQDSIYALDSTYFEDSADFE